MRDDEDRHTAVAGVERIRPAGGVDVYESLTSAARDAICSTDTMLTSVTARR